MRCTGGTDRVDLSLSSSVPAWTYSCTRDACRGGDASALLAGLLVVVERFGQDTGRKVRLWRAAL